jgi:hypothetical protein
MADAVHGVRGLRLESEREGSDFRDVESVFGERTGLAMPSAAELYRWELALAELQDLIFVNDTRAYLEYSIEGRLAKAYIEEHRAEIMA